MLSPAHIASSQIRSKRWIPTTRPLNFVEPSLGHKTRPTHTALRQLRQLLKDDIICFKTYQEWSIRISTLRSGLGPTSFWIFWDFGDFGSSRPQDTKFTTFELQIPFAFVSWEYWVYHNLMSSHLNLDSFRSKHVKILFIYVFVFLLWFDLCCLGSPTSSALRVLDIALPAVATSYPSMSTELNRPSHPSQLRFVLLKEELPARIFGWNGWNLGLAQGSVCSTLTYKTYKLRSFKSDHPYLSTFMCFHTSRLDTIDQYCLSSFIRL